MIKIFCKSCKCLITNFYADNTLRDEQPINRGIVLIVIISLINCIMNNLLNDHIVQKRLNVP